MMYGNPPSGGLDATGAVKYSDFGRIEGYISETATGVSCNKSLAVA